MAHCIVCILARKGCRVGEPETQEIFKVYILHNNEHKKLNGKKCLSINVRSGPLNLDAVRWFVFYPI